MTAQTYSEAEVVALKAEAFRAGREKGRNEVGLILSSTRSALWAIGYTLDDHELRPRAKESYEDSATLAQALEQL